MKHFIYKTTHKNGKYYIGRHSTSNLDDGYMGSGRWVRQIKDKTSLTREVLEFVDDAKTLILREGQYLKEHYGQLNCMNQNLDPVGFGPGDMNPMNNLSSRAKISGDNHWSFKHPDSFKEKIGGDNHWMNKNPQAKQKFLDNHPNKDGRNAKLAYARGTHNSLTKNPSIINAENGTHHWQQGRSPNAGGKLNKKLVAAGTHNFLGPDLNNKRIKEGTHNLMGADSNLKRLAAGTHPSQQKLTCACGKTVSIGMFKRWHGNNCKQLKETK